MIWESVFLMSVIDVLIVIAAVYLGVVLYRNYPATKKLGLNAGINAILLGLITIALFYFWDLSIMHVLPAFSSHDYARAAMVDWHLNWSWLLTLVAVSAITVGLANVIRRVIPKAVFALEDFERQVQERTAALQATNAKLHQSETRYRTFVDNTTAGIADISLRKPVSMDLPVEDQIQGLLEHAYYHDVNNELAKIYGYESAKRLKGKRFVEHFVASDPCNIRLLTTFIQSGYRSKSAESYEVDVQGNPRILLNNIIGIVQDGYLLSAWSSSTDITERKRLEENTRLHTQELCESRETLRNLALGLQELRERERTAIAREIHDELGQVLTSLRIDLAWLVDKLPKNRKELHDRGRAMVDLAGSSVDTVRRIASSLRPAILDDLGLAAAIQWMVRDFGARTGIQFLVEVEDLEPAWGVAARTAAFRIFQEALTNVSRHAGATTVEVRLTRQDNEFTLEVIDNGVGIDDGALTDPRSLGLLGMRERAAVLGWGLDIGKNLGAGTKVALRIPHSSQRARRNREASRERNVLA